jgi:hypothetical protein
MCEPLFNSNLPLYGLKSKFLTLPEFQVFCNIIYITFIENDPVVFKSMEDKKKIFIGMYINNTIPHPLLYYYSDSEYNNYRSTDYTSYNV